MKIYFGGSISGGRDYVKIYAEIIKFLESYGEVLTKHVGDPKLTEKGQNEPSSKIYSRDVSLLDSCDILIAEVTQPSLGVGYEIARTEAAGKPIICMWKRTPGKRLSPMIGGNKKIRVIEYNSMSDLKKQLFAMLAEIFA